MISPSKCKSPNVAHHFGGFSSAVVLKYILVFYFWKTESGSKVIIQEKRHTKNIFFLIACQLFYIASNI